MAYTGLPCRSDALIMLLKTHVLCNVQSSQALNKVWYVTREDLTHIMSRDLADEFQGSMMD